MFANLYLLFRITGRVRSSVDDAVIVNFRQLSVGLYFAIDPIVYVLHYFWTLERLLMVTNRLCMAALPIMHLVTATRHISRRLRQHVLVESRVG